MKKIRRIVVLGALFLSLGGSFLQSYRNDYVEKQNALDAKPCEERDVAHS